MREVGCLLGWTRDRLATGAGCLLRNHSPPHSEGPGLQWGALRSFRVSGLRSAGLRSGYDDDAMASLVGGIGRARSRGAGGDRMVTLVRCTAKAPEALTGSLRPLPQCTM